MYWRDPVNESRLGAQPITEIESIIDSGIAIAVDEPAEEDWLLTVNRKERRAICICFEPYRKTTIGETT